MDTVTALLTGDEDTAPIDTEIHRAAHLCYGHK